MALLPLQICTVYLWIYITTWCILCVFSTVKKNCIYLIEIPESSASWQTPLDILALITFPPPKKICKNEGSMRMGYSRTTLIVMQNSFQEKYRFILQRISLWKLNCCCCFLTILGLVINPWVFGGTFLFDVQRLHRLHSKTSLLFVFWCVHGYSSSEQIPGDSIWLWGPLRYEVWEKLWTLEIIHIL